MHPATKNKRRLLLAGIGAGIGAADGTVALAASPFHAPNEYARRIARSHPGYFKWAASIHPYRADCVAVLEQTVSDGARWNTACAWWSRIALRWEKTATSIAAPTVRTSQASGFLRA